MESGKYIIGENVTIKSATIKDLENIKKFQREIIDSMENKEWFTPLTKYEFTYPLENNGKINLLYYNKELIGLYVLTINPEKNIIKEYELENKNIAILDSIMIKEQYRGSNLQRQGMKIIEEEACNLNIELIVATVHPENIYSLNNFIKENYKIIKKHKIHGGPRFIVVKNIVL